MITRLFLPFFCFFSLCTHALFAQNYTVSGYVKDERSGETLIGVNILNKAKPSEGTATNTYGFFSLTLPKGTYTLRVSYVGFADREIEVDLTAADKSLNVSLAEGVVMQEVVITAEQKDKNVESTRMGEVTLPVENIKKLPLLFGEADVLKAIQLLPGVKSIEGSSGLYIRGGGIDQNLVLLDEAVVYNPGHLLGFVSVFNADAIKNTTLIKGGMPAQYGGRLSSVLDIQMKEGNNQNFGVEGGIGLIASRLTIEGPIVKNKASFIISTRRTYALDLAQPAINNTRFAGTNYYFYDLNAKINYTISDKDRLYLSGYFGRDVFKLNSRDQGFKFDLPYGNATATLRWNHVFNKKLFMNLAAIYNDYNFSAGGGQDIFNFKAESGVRDYNAKLDFDFYPNPKHTVKFGANYTYHRLSPNVISGSNGDTTFTNSERQKSKFGHEVAFYVADNWKITPRLTLDYGLRLSGFQQIGPHQRREGDVVREYKSGEAVKTYYGFEPRLGGKVTVDPQSSIKFGVTATTQYLHLVSNSTSSLPADVWVMSSDIVAPQRGIQYALGYFRNFDDNAWETSLEFYYKDLQNQIDYPETYLQDPAFEVEQSFVFGKGRAYGAELFIQRKKGRLNGWVGYTFSRTLREFPDINQGRVFPAVFDRIHDVVVVANYQLSRKWELSGNFVYGTGNAFTPLKSFFIIQQNLNLEYADRNSGRYQDYHRLDFGATFTPKPDKKGFRSSWTFSVYNIYNRLNPLFSYYDIGGNLSQGNFKPRAVNVTLFPVIPSVTWNFKWQQRAKEKKPTSGS